MTQSGIEPDGGSALHENVGRLFTVLDLRFPQVDKWDVTLACRKRSLGSYPGTNTLFGMLQPQDQATTLRQNALTIYSARFEVLTAMSLGLKSSGMLRPAECLTLKMYHYDAQQSR